jgi:oligopeptidase B
MAERTASPPVAAQRPHSTTAFGEQRDDPYYWLRQRDNPEVIAHLEAENSYTASVLRHTEALQRALFDEMVGHIAASDQSAPGRVGSYWYYTRTERDKQYKIYCRTFGQHGPEEVLLDENVLAEGHPYFRLGTFKPSPDQRLLAYAIDTNGSERFDLYVKDLASGAIVDGPIPNVAYDVEWSADGSTLFNVTPDAAWRTDTLMRHALGTSASDDTVAYREDDESFWVHLSKTRSGAFLVLHSKSNTSSEIMLLAADRPGESWRLLVPRRPQIECSVDHSGDWLYLRTNEDAQNFKVVRVPVGRPDAPPETVIAHDPSIGIDMIDLFAGHMAVSEREGGLQHIRIVELASGAEQRVSFDEPIYALWQVESSFFNQVFETAELRFSYSSLVTPPSVYDYDMASHQRTLRKREDVPGYSPERYQSERIFATAADGAQVPISLVYRADTPRDGSAPLFLYGYGAYGATIDPEFDARRLPLLDRGFIYAIAHIRGGGELGRAWYEQGKLLQKRNTFTDFIACAEALVAQGYCDPERVAIKGRSAGGLLMGAVTTMRPDLFRAVIAGVPFVDVVNTSLDPTIPLVINEYEEWGDPRQREQYEYLRSYSPYDNTTARAYPSILATAGLYDPRVQYWEPAKWVARLRQLKTDSNPVLLKTEMVGGHAGPSGRYDYLKDLALEYAFVLDALGLLGAENAP